MKKCIAAVLFSAVFTPGPVPASEAALVAPQDSQPRGALGRDTPDANRTDAGSQPQDIREQHSEGTYTVPGITIGSTTAAAENARAINDVMAAANASGGGTVQLPCGSIYISSPIDNIYSRVLVRGCGRDFYHDGGRNATYGTKILPTAAINVLVHETPAGRLNSKNTGGGFKDITVDGNSLGLNLLRVISVNSGVYDLTLLNSVGTEAAYFGALTTGVDLGEAADIQYAHVNLTVRQVDGKAARATNGVVLDGSSNANFSANTDVTLQVQHANGHALICRNADNNSISIRAFRVDGGTGDTIYGFGSDARTGCYSNVFANVSGNGPVYMRGTSDGDARGVVNRIARLDTANASPAPTAGTASSWQWTESETNAAARFRGYHAMIGNSAADIIGGAKSQAPTTSLDVIDASSDALRIRTPTNDVAWSVGTNGPNLRVLAVTGSHGAFETAQIKLTEQRIASLPKCDTNTAGTVTAVSDAKATAYNTSLSEGGTSHILAYCNGTNWTAH